MKKHILVTHTDIDGIGALTLFRSICNEYGLNGEDHSVEISDVDAVLRSIIDKDLSKNKVVNLYIVDVTPRDTAVIERLNYYSHYANIILLDHHETAIDRFVGYENWAEINTEMCGAFAFWRYLSCNKREYDRVTERFYSYMHTVDAADRWLKDSEPEDFFVGRRHALLLNMLGTEEYISNRLFMIDPDQFTDSEKNVLSVLETEQAAYVDEKIKSIMTYNHVDGGLNFPIAVVFCDRYISEIAEEMRVRGMTDYVAVAGIYMSSKAVSLRSIQDDFHVDEFAKQMSNRGGGHPKSAGFFIDDDVRINSFIQNVFTGKE